MPDDVQLSNHEEQARRLAEALRRQLGVALCELLRDPNVVELMLNADGRVWVERLGEPMRPVGHMAAATAEIVHRHRRLHPPRRRHPG